MDRRDGQRDVDRREARTRPREVLGDVRGVPPKYTVSPWYSITQPLKLVLIQSTSAP
jgi:hypothetical protein